MVQLGHTQKTLHLILHVFTLFCGLDKQLDCTVTKKNKNRIEM